MIHIYHYTNITSFLSILDNAELWATHSSLLNDADEISYFREQFKNVLTKQIRNEKYRALLLKIFNGAVDRNNTDSFIISFSKSNDRIGLWSSYANGEGCCIDFCLPELLRNVNSKNNFDLNDYQKGFYYSLTPRDEILAPNSRNEITEEESRTVFANILCGSVTYSDRRITDELKGAIDNWCDLLDKCTDDDNFFMPDFFIEDYTDKMYFMKRSGFSGEDEFRIVFRFMNQDIGKNYIFFRTRKNIIIPYIKVRIKTIPGVISKVILDPKSEIESASIGLKTYFRIRDWQKIKIVESNMKMRY